MTPRLPSLLLPALVLVSLTACTASGAGPTTPMAPTQVGSEAPGSIAGPSGSPTATPSLPDASATGRTPQRTYRAADGTCTLPAGLLGKDHENLGTTEKKIALTFDGGAGSKGATRILDTLQEKGAAATFFFTGQFATKNPDLVKQVAQKYPIGNHSWNHPGFVSKKLSNAEIASQLDRAEGAIEEASGGINPQPFFRYPEGDRNAATTVQVNKACYVPVRWSIDTLGWVGTKGAGRIPGQSVDAILKTVLDAPASSKNGGIVLMHVGEASGDGSTLDADALPGIIDGLAKQGYTFVTLEELFEH